MKKTIFNFVEWEPKTDDGLLKPYTP